MTNTILLIILGYVSGSVLYSKLIAQYVLKVNIASVGDGNPGTTNVAKAGGAKWAVIAFILDCLKATIPTAIGLYIFQITNWQIVLIAIAPAVGHTYPLFTKFKGGKAIAAVSGSWIAFATWEVITIGGLLLLFWYLSVEESAWATIFMVLSVGVYLILRSAPALWLEYWVASLLWLIWTHRKNLATAYPGTNTWVKSLAALWHR